MRDMFKSSVAAIGLVTALTGCGNNSQNLEGEGLEAKATPEVTATCYDYSGEVLLKTSVNTDDVSIQSNGIVISQSGHQPVIVTNGGGCTIETKYGDFASEKNQSGLQEALNKADVYGIVTNASDKVLYQGKFNEVSYDSTYGSVEWVLKSAEGNKISKLVVIGGLNAIATDKKESLGANLQGILTDVSPK